MAPDGDKASQQRPVDSLGRFKANGVRIYLFGSIVNLPDQVNIKKYHFTLGDIVFRQ